MAAQQNKPQEVTINLKAEVQKLKELRDTISDLKKDGKLANTNENTYKALFNQIEQAIKRMNEAIRDGAVGTKGLQNIQKGIEGITSSITKMVTQERSTGLGMKDYLKELEQAQKAVDTLKNKIKDFQQQQANLNINEKGNVKKGQEGDVMAAARKASRESRGGKGGDTKAEAMLKTGDLKAIQEQAATGNKDAQKALELYNAELSRQRDVLADLVAKLDEYKERLNFAKNHLSDIKDTAAFDEEAVAELEKAAQSTEKMGKAVEETKKKMDEHHESSAKVVDGHKKMESSASKAAKSFIKFNVVTKTLKKLLKEGIDAVIEMDKALTDMSIVTGKSRAELQKMIPDFNALGRATGATSTEIAGLTAEYMKQGRTMKDSMELAEQTAKAAKISGISTAESIKYMTSAINGFNLAAKDAEHVSDVFAKLGAASATDYKDLAIALSKVSAQANTAGMSMEFTTTLLAKGLEVTQEAPESIGTALKTVLARFRELSDYGTTLEDGVSVNKVENALGAVGISLRDANGQFRDMEEIFTELGPQWDNLNTMQQQAIAQAVAGTRQQSRFLAIMQDWDRTIELSNAALDAEGATMYQHAQYAQSLEFSINKLQTAWQGFISGLTDSDLIRDTFSFVSEVVSKLVDLINFLNNISGGLVGTMMTIGSVAAILTGLIKDRLRVMEEERIIREAQIADIQKRQAAEQAATAEVKKQLDLKKEMQQIENDMANKKGVKETFNEGAEAVRIKKEQMEHAKDMKTRKKDLKELAKLKNKYNKTDTKDTKTRQKLEEKIQKKQDKFKKDELKRLGKAKKVQEDNLSLQENNLKVIEEKLKNENLGEKEKLALVQQKAAQEKAIETTNANIKAIKDQEEKLDAANLTTSSSELVLDEASLATKTVEKEVEEEITEEGVEQNVVGAAGVVIDETSNAAKTKGLGLSIKQRLEDTKDAVVKAAGAFAEAVKSLGVPAGPIVGAALLAIIGGIIGVGIAAGGGNLGSGDRDKKMAENQNTIYEAKEKKNNILQYRDEYEELNNKTFKTQEEIDRMAEIEEALKELDDNITGTGDDLLKSIDAQTSILDNQINNLIDTNFMYASKNASKGDISDETKLALRQKAQKESLEDLNNNTELSDSDKASINNAVQNMFGNLSDDDYKAIFDKEMSKEDKQAAKQAVKDRKAEIDKQLDDLKAAYDRGELTKDEYKQMKKELKNNKKSLTADSMFDEQNYENMIEKVTAATTKIYQAESGSLSEQLQAYNESLEGLDETSKKMIEQQFGDLAMLAKYENQVTTILSNSSLGIAESGLRNFAKTLNEAGVSAEGFKQAMDAIAAEGFNGLLNMSDEEMAEMLGVSVDDPEFQAKKDKILLQALYDLTGVSSTSLKESRTNLESQAENVNDLQSKLISGEKLSQEDEEYLASNFADLWANKEFQESLKGDGVYAAKMMEQAQTASREDKIKQGESLIQGEKDLLNEKYNVDFETLSGMSKEELIAQFGEDAANDITMRIGQIYSDQANLDAIKDYKYEYEGLTAEARKLEESTAKYEAIQEKIDKNGGIGSAEDYAQMSEYAQDMVDKAQKQYDLTHGKLSKAFGDQLDKLISIDEETGQVTVNMEEYASLSGAEKEFFDEQLAVLEEQNDALQEQKDLVEEIARMQRDAQIEIQNQAIAAMQARLDAEYEATQQSLDKRRDLYNKYFDSLEQEEETANYETDRQALLNKIASLSTATDSESLSKLKEAQEALADLDNEKLSSDREMRREAVEESFDKQEEDLDAAYENAMSDVQGMWEEFCSMAGEDQLALFQQYGEGFQEVTDLQKEMAMETLQATMDAIASYGFVGVTPTPKPAYAEGGLVDFTGPAWVDGSKTKPEAFLDPEDTNNIGMLAQGLRAMVNNIFSPKEEAKSVNDISTLNIEEFNINVGLAGNMIETGRDVADGFMKAIRELGININKKG